MALRLPLHLVLGGCVMLLAAGVALASPFVNTELHPDLNRLRPVVSAAAVAAEVTMPAEGTLLSEEGLPPALVISFAQMGPDQAADNHGDVWGRMRAGFMMPPLPIKEVQEMQMWFAARPQQVVSVFARSRAYMFHIVDEVKKRNMPMELALLPFIESGYDPMALSSAQALGLWQFIPETGLRYNLPQNALYDARRDVAASTSAALDYLQFLYNMFQDWHLALAAYNCGENAVAAAIERNRAKRLPTDFASLTLPAETRYYVPRLLAVKNIVADPKSFGVVLPHVPNEPYFSKVAWRSKGKSKTEMRLDIRDAARLAGLDIEEFRALNAAHKDGIITVGTMSLVVPRDKAHLFGIQLGNYLDREEARSQAQDQKFNKRPLIR